jgi:hypothetical protein
MVTEDDTEKNGGSSTITWRAPYPRAGRRPPNGGIKSGGAPLVGLFQPALAVDGHSPRWTCDNASAPNVYTTSPLIEANK